MSLDDYILSHIDPEGEYLHALWRDTQLKLSYGQMASGHLQGRLLKMLVEMIRPHRVIELGTFSGYSALSMAEGLPEGAELHTIEVYDENEDFLRRWIGGSPWADRIHLHIGDALDIIPTLGDRWDLAFVDADKREYVKYYEMLLPRMNPGGFILADNTLWYGRITEEARASDLQTRGLQEFNDLVANDPRVEKVILPLRDGLSIIRKR
ncbi:MAG: class I SAM-dependent methyltransferase [Bacteroidaceae bacterium]|nr:class I SAM-dependent methyltransferase [Bacteroidaceae bacterium]MBR6820354.1 class I SAM-dependent methyltransferase [Bacteroidaceae bacterium]MBR7052338.1 class I SAM-dependent methyltransferase [Bacteroidaceae bacterium]